MLRYYRRGGGRGGGHGAAGRGGGHQNMPAPPPVSIPPAGPQSNNFAPQNQQNDIPFDITFNTEPFPRGSEPDDAPLTAALLKRNAEVTPSAEEIQAIQNLVTRVQGIIENIILSPGTFTACQVDEIRQVGSFKQGTILAGHRTADFVVILKTFPTKEAIEALHTRVADELKQTECLRSSTTVHGFDLSNVQGTVRILITTVAHNMRKLDPAIHMDPKLMNEHWQAIKHSRWVEENANSSTIKVLVRIFRDIRNRYEPMKPLVPLMLDLLAHYIVTNTPNHQPLALAPAFRRAMMLMSSGLFLPTYAGTSMRGIRLSDDESDKITAASQTLLLILLQGGHDTILGMEKDKDILNSPTVWDGVVIRPSAKAFELVEPMDDSEIDDEAVSSPVIQA